MTASRRFDKSSKLGKAAKLDNGFLKAPSYLTRVGVFEYVTAEGKKRRELRLPEEVFNSDSLSSFELVPLTNEHPSTEVTAKTAKQTQIGTVGQDVRADGDFVSATLMITDAAAVEQVESGKLELSCGYYCDLDHTAGEWVDASGANHRYDAIQRNIRGNHVALVKKGRAGPAARIYLDAADALQVDCESTDLQEPDQQVIEESKPMEKIKLDGVEFEVSPTVAAAFTGALEAQTKSLEALKTDLEKVTARADAAESQLATVSKNLEVAVSPARVAALVTARVALENKARDFVPAEVKFDGLSDNEIKVSVVKVLAPDLNLDGKSEEYISASFEALSVAPVKKNPAGEQLAEKIAKSETIKVDGRSAREQFEAKLYGREK